MLRPISYSRFLSAFCCMSAVLMSGPAIRAHGEDPAMIQAIIQAITEELAKAPDAELYLRRGELYRHGEDWARAEADFAAAGRCDPRNAFVLFLRGRTLLDAGQPAAAESLAGQFCQRAPANPEAWFLRGEIRAALNQPNLAFADYAEGFRRASSANPDEALHWTGLMAALPSSDPAKVLAVLDDALARLGSLPALVDFAIEVEVRRKNYAAAVARIDRALRPGRWPGTLLARRGDILAKSGQPVAAVESYRAALAAIEKLSARNRAVADVQKLEHAARYAITQLASD